MEVSGCPFPGGGGCFSSFFVADMSRIGSSRRARYQGSFRFGWQRSLRFISVNDQCALVAVCGNADVSFLTLRRSTFSVNLFFHASAKPRCPPHQTHTHMWVVTVCSAESLPRSLQPTVPLNQVLSRLVHNVCRCHRHT